MTTLVKRGTARRLGLRDTGRWLRFAELIGSSPSAGEAFKQYQQPLMDAIQRKREQFAPAWEELANLARTNFWSVDPGTDAADTRVWVAGYLAEQQEGP